MNLPSVRQLLAAVDISKSKSLSSTADRIAISQSAVSQSIKRLEELVGESLFTRTSTGVYANELGNVFLQRVQRGLQRLVAIEQIVVQASNRHSNDLVRKLSNAHLRCFIATVESGSFNLAANQLQLTQPTVHRAVSDFEVICDFKFFQRSPYGVEPNWQARQIAKHAGVYFREVEQAIEAVNDQVGNSSSYLRIGALPLAAASLLPDAITQVVKEYPNTKVQIVDGPYDEQLASLLHGQLDAIVGALRYPLPSQEVQQEMLFDEPLNVIVRHSHPLTLQEVPPLLSDLSGLDWIAPRSNTPARDVFNRLFDTNGLARPSHIIECSSTVAVRGLLLGSDKAALLPVRQVEVDIKNGLLAVLKTELPGTERDIGITTLKHWQPTKVQQRLFELLRSAS